MPGVNEFLLRTKKGEFGFSQRRLLVRGRSKINRLKEQTDLTFFPTSSTEGEKRSRDQEGLSEVGARLCPSPQ